MLGQLLKNIFRDIVPKKQDSSHVRAQWSALDSVMAAFNGKNYREVLRQCQATLLENPRHPLANHFCGKAYIFLDDDESAIPHLQAALSGDPGFCEAHFDLAAVYFRQKNTELAERHARQAVELSPLDWRYQLMLADVLEDLGQQAEALKKIALAQELAPDRFDVLQRLMKKLDQLGRFEMALQIAERAYTEIGETYETLFFQGYARFVTGDHEGSIDFCHRAIAIRNNEPGVYVTLGSAYLGLGRIAESVSSYKRALKILPGYPDAVFHLAMLNLMRGRYRDGWADFEFRFKGPRSTKRICEPRWNGTSLKGRVLHIMREQGLGDDIMYSSCYPQVMEDADHCLIECEPRLLKLFRRSFPGASIYPIIDNPSKSEVLEIEGIDVRIFSASIPRYLRNSVRDFPEHQGYLRSDPERAAYWRGRLSELGAGLKVGISWRGGTVHTHRKRRTLSLDLLQSLLSIPGVHWINLQYGNRAEEIAAFGEKHGIAIIDWPEAIDGDYDETAALVDGLDLVISVCTSVIHLTGALGREAHVMVPFAPEWRYGLQGDRMPWYPAVRLHRQNDPQDWSPVIAEVAAVLKARLTASGLKS